MDMGKILHTSKKRIKTIGGNNHEKIYETFCFGRYL